MCPKFYVCMHIYIYISHVHAHYMYTCTCMHASHVHVCTHARVCTFVYKSFSPYVRSMAFSASTRFFSAAYYYYFRKIRTKRGGRTNVSKE